MRRAINNQFIIRNFRSWRGTNFIDIDRINLFFGANSSGKSSILHAFALLKQSFSAEMAVGNLIPKGSEIDLGRIEDQISKVAKKEEKTDVTLSFGLRFNNTTSLRRGLGLRARSRMARTRNYRNEIHNEGFSSDAMGRLLDKMGPIDFLATYNKEGQLIDVRVLAAGKTILGLSINHGRSTLECQLETSSDCVFWDEAIDWDKMQAGDLPFGFDVKRRVSDLIAEQKIMSRHAFEMQQTFQQLSVEIMEAEKNGQKADPEIVKQKKMTELGLRKLARQRELIEAKLANIEDGHSKPTFAGSNIEETKSNFFRALQVPFQVKNHPDSNSNFEFRSLFSTRYSTRSRWAYTEAILDDEDESSESAEIPLKTANDVFKFLKTSGFSAIELLQLCDRSLTRFVSDFEQIGPHRERPDRITFLNPSEKASSVGSKGENVVPIIFRASKNEIREINSWMKDLDIDYRIKKQFEARYNIAELKLEDSDKNEISLADVGYGIGQILPIIMVAVMQKDRIISIEQPELHLHPRLQANLADLFVWSAQRKNNVFFLETHSEHMVLRLQRRQRELNDGGQGVGIVRRPSGSGYFNLVEPWSGISSSVSIQVVDLQSAPKKSLITSVGINSKGDFRDYWPGDFFPERYFEKGML